MKETNIKNAKTAVTITTVLTFFAAGFEVILAFMGSKPGMNIFDIASFAMANPNVYCLILILVNIILLPSAILLYRQNGISLKKEIAEKETTDYAEIRHNQSYPEKTANPEVSQKSQN